MLFCGLSKCFKNYTVKYFFEFFTTIVFLELTLIYYNNKDFVLKIIKFLIIKIHIEICSYFIQII